MSSSKNRFDPQAVLGEIRRQVIGSQTHARGKERKLYSALKHTFELEDYLQKQGELQNFVENRQPKFWNKTAEKNSFLPLVKLGFEDLEKASASQYSTVLKYCSELKLNADEFGEYLKEYGIVKLYNKSRDAASASSMDKRFELDMETQLDWAEKQLLGRASIGNVKIGSNSAFGDAGQLEIAFVKSENGLLQIIDRVELAAKTRDQMLLKAAGSPPTKKHSLLTDKDLYGLFKASDIFCRFLSNAKEQLTEEDRQALEEGEIPASYFSKTGLLLEHKDGSWIAKTVSELPTFKCVRVETNGALDKLNPSKRYFLGSAYCRILVDEFPVEGKWFISQTKSGTFIRKTGEQLKLPLLDFETFEIDQFQFIDPTRKVEIQFELPKHRLSFLSTWKQRHAKSQQDHIRFPPLLELKLDGQALLLGFPYHRLITHQIAVPKAITDTELIERYVKYSDLQDLADVAVDYDLNFSAGVFTTYEKHCGIELQSLDQGVSIALPLAISISGDLGQVTGNSKALGV
ncbi:MAG: hypothetical protein ABJM29_10650 [Rhizobiaceae bacterium]